jgi:polyisoprenoid-binding protein YceI
MFKRAVMTVVISSLISLPAMAADWNIDKAHSNIGFKVSHLVISSVTGQFNDYSANFKFDPDKPEEASVDVTIRMTSIDTENEDRDNHLRSPDFFNVEKFPIMTFASKKVAMNQDSTFTMVGDLTIKDVTREITLKGKLNGIIQGPGGKTRAGFAAETIIDRQDFNVSWANKLQDGSLVVGNDVDIILDIELIQAE